MDKKYTEEFKMKCVKFYLDYYKKQNEVYRPRRKNTNAIMRKYYYKSRDIYHPDLNPEGSIEKRIKRVPVNKKSYYYVKKDIYHPELNPSGRYEKRFKRILT